MQIPDIYQSLDYAEPLNRYHIQLGVLRQQIEVLMIDTADGASVGFWVLYPQRRGQVGREFDVAVPEARQRGLAKAAGVAFESWCFDEQKLPRVWACIAADNAACIGLVRSCAWPLSEVVSGVKLQGAPRDVVYTHMTPELRAGLTAKRGF